VCVPAGALETYGLMVTGPEGEAMVGVNCGAHPRFDPLGRETLGLLQIVLPALQSGFETLARVRSAWSVLAATLDTLEVGMLAFSARNGREFHRNVAAAELLGSAKESALIVRQANAIARALRFHDSDDRATRQTAWRASNLRIAGEEYRLRGTLLPGGTLGEDSAILVTLERTAPRLPELSALREELGLTAREAEITLGLAKGHDNATIACALGISPHTVGHHVERIFIKLGIRSRKALGLSLLRLRRQPRA
jgi:DNA-binding CsgD family transcriptional regulator